MNTTELTLRARINVECGEHLSPSETKNQNYLNCHL